MDSNTLLRLMINHLTTLQRNKQVYFEAGDVVNYTAADQDITDTMVTVSQLQTIIDSQSNKGGN